MAYFKIGSTDFSNVTSALSVGYKHKYNSRDNILGNTRIDYITRKRTVTVNIIPINMDQMNTLLAAIDDFAVTISIKSPKTNQLINISAKVNDYQVNYYTIQSSRTLFQAFTLTFEEL